MSGQSNSSPRHTFKATKEALLDLYQHSVEVRVWNSRDKLSARARYDQPRAVRLPATAARKGRGSGAESGDERGASARPASFLIVNHSEVCSMCVLCRAIPVPVCICLYSLYTCRVRSCNTA